jgi:hypothetical protein
VSICPLPFGASVRDGGAEYKFPALEPDSGARRYPRIVPRDIVMKKLIIAAFALSMLGAGAAEALTIGINTGHHARHHRHQVCSWHHHHRSCHWR